MAATLNVHDILSRVRELDKDEQFTLLERLIALIRKHEDALGVSRLSSIFGVGSEMWKEKNIDEYIEQVRQSKLPPFSLKKYL